MKHFIFSLILILTIYSCSKPKTVMICGDHICVNKEEANQYFEENLTLEVKIIDAKKKGVVNLVELNLEKNSFKDKKISMKSKKKTNEKIKILTQEEVRKIKLDIKRKKLKKVVTNDNQGEEKGGKLISKRKSKIKEKSHQKENVSILESTKSYKKRSNVVDICTIIDKCSIDEISKYLIKEGKNKSFPDITKRE